MTLRLVSLLLLVAALASEPAAAKSFVDSAGRSVQVPDRIERVYAAGHPATIVLYTLAPEKLIAWTRPLGDAVKERLIPAARDLPVMGRLTGRGNTANVEIVLKAKPDLILDYGSVKPTFVSLADRVQEQTGLPMVLIDGRFEAIAESYRLLGRLLGVEARAETLARYVEDMLARVDRTIAKVPVAKRPRVYYARGGNGLETGRRGSINVEAIDRVGAVNVAAAAGEGGLARISLENVILWKPEILVTTDPEFFRTVGSHPQWRALAAVREGRVHIAPELPFGWFDRPPSVNRLIGLPWLLHLFYPGAVEGSLGDEVKAFYELFYHVSLTDADVARLLVPPEKP